MMGKCKNIPDNMVFIFTGRFVISDVSGMKACFSTFEQITEYVIET